MSLHRVSSLLFTAAFFLAASNAVAQTDPVDASGYNLPPKNILDVMRAPEPPIPVVSPGGDKILLVS